MRNPFGQFIRIDHSVIVVTSSAGGKKIGFPVVNQPMGSKEKTNQDFLATLQVDLIV